jgi:hypothetical protein
VLGHEFRFFSFDSATICSQNRFNNTSIKGVSVAGALITQEAALKDPVGIRAASGVDYGRSRKSETASIRIK